MLDNERNFIEEAAKREFDRYADVSRNADVVLLVLTTSAPITITDELTPVSFESLHDILDTKKTCIALDDSELSLRAAEFLVKFPDLVGRDIKVLTDYPDQEPVQAIESLLGFFDKASFTRIVSDLSHLSMMRSQFTESELEANLAMVETNQRSSKDGTVKELLDFDASSANALEELEATDDD
nr:MAG: hypothetical protein 3 [Guangxi cystovirus 12]